MVTLFLRLEPLKTELYFCNFCAILQYFEITSGKSMLLKSKVHYIIELRVSKTNQTYNFKILLFYKCAFCKKRQVETLK